MGRISTLIAGNDVSVERKRQQLAKYALLGQENQNLGDALGNPKTPPPQGGGGAVQAQDCREGQRGRVAR